MNDTFSRKNMTSYLVRSSASSGKVQLFQQNKCKTRLDYGHLHEYMRRVETFENNHRKGILR